MLHENLRKLREEYDISAKRIAKFMQVEEEDVLAWEHREKEPSLKQIHELADLFAITYNDLLGDMGDKKANTTEASLEKKGKKKSKKKVKKKNKTKNKTKKVKEKKVEKKQNWPLIILLIIVLIAGCVGGFLYWKYGDEYALIKNKNYQIDDIVGTFILENEDENKTSLLLQSDGTYTINFNNCSTDMQALGMWSLKENEITLKDSAGISYQLKISSSNKLKFKSEAYGCSITKNNTFIRGSITQNNEDPTEDEKDKEDESEQPTVSYIREGQWSGDNSTLSIHKISDSQATFTLQSSDPLDATHVASIEDIVGEISGNILNFTFEDDGYGNAGFGSIIFEATQSRFTITKTKTNENAEYAILDSGTLLY